MLVIALLPWFGGLSFGQEGGAAPDPRLPSLVPSPPYVSSEACRTCHQKEHASWHRSFHRSMTQIAKPETVAGAFDGTTVISDDLAYTVYTDGKELMAEMPDPDVMMYMVQGGRKIPLEKIPRAKRPVVMTTGSHHYQTYWVASERYQGLLQTLPLVYLIKDKRWVPREEAFIRGPADRGRMVTQWNHHCIRCHSTAGNPGLDEKGMLKSRVAELGIACEACHGPGQAHVLRQQALAKDPKPKGSEDPDTTVVNPARLDHRRSSMVCGQCHGLYVTRDEYAMRFAREGVLFRPGEDLNKTRYYMQHPHSNPTPASRADLQRNPKFYSDRWWGDGTILGAGREYTGLMASACYKKGEISCVSCHSMHRSDPDDQLKQGADTAQACVGCHHEPKFNAAISTHTFHSANSEGSNCLNCHMPYTSYALLKAIRSHQISSPKVEASARFGTPNACNLCHLDKTLAWAQRNLVKQYGHKQIELTVEQRDVAASILWLLKGNAAQRVIAAWHTGWEPAQRASGNDWLAPFSARLLGDPYGVIRYVAARSLKSLPGFSDFSYDFLGKSNYLSACVAKATQVWESRPAPEKRGDALLLDAEGRVEVSKLEQFLRDRDEQSITIQE